MTKNTKERDLDCILIEEVLDLIRSRTTDGFAIKRAQMRTRWFLKGQVPARAHEHYQEIAELIAEILCQDSAPLVASVAATNAEAATRRTTSKFDKNAEDDIRARLESGTSASAIARQLGVHRSTIGRIAKRG